MFQGGQQGKLPEKFIVVITFLSLLDKEEQGPGVSATDRNDASSKANHELKDGKGSLSGNRKISCVFSQKGGLNGMKDPGVK